MCESNSGRSGVLVTLPGAMRKHRHQVDVSVETSVARFRSSCATRGPHFHELRKQRATAILIPVPLVILKFLKDLRRILEELQNRRRWYHTTSPSASPAFVVRMQSGHRIPHSTFVTIAKRPSLFEAGRGELMPVICPTPQAKFFSREGWTDGQITAHHAG